MSVEMDGARLIVGIGGTFRAQSSSEAALRVALTAAEAAGARTTVFAGAELDLPMYDPGRAERPEAARRMVDAVRRADGVIIATPGYHGGMSGLVKNALDYLEDLREDDRPYLDGRAVGCIASAAGWQGSVATLVALRSVVHALRGWPTPLGVSINSTERVFGPGGTVVDSGVAEQLALLGRAVTGVSDPVTYASA